MTRRPWFKVAFTILFVLIGLGIGHAGAQYTQVRAGSTLIPALHIAGVYVFFALAFGVAGFLIIFRNR